MTGQLISRSFKLHQEKVPGLIYRDEPEASFYDTRFSKALVTTENRTSPSKMSGAQIPTIMRGLARRSAQQLRTSRRRTPATTRSYSSEDAPPPPLLAKLKGDLKTAMRAKDAP